MILVGVVLVGALILGALVSSYATTQNRLWNERLQAEKIAVVKAEAERIEKEAEEATKAEAEADNGLEMSFVYCPAGSFTMGSPSRETKRQDDEDQVRVTISKGFLLGKYEVTQKEWESVMGSNPSNFKGARLPVEKVRWEEATKFCRKFTEQERRAGRLGAKEMYRLPTEAEWEYGCRAGTTSPFSYGSSLSSREANFNVNYPYGGASKGAYLEKTANVGSYKGNAWGLHDMHGNVWEWCQDWYGENLPGGTDPSVAFTGWPAVLRGGGWFNLAQFCRSAYRFWNTPSLRLDVLGFRVARVPIH
jgi:eukaryotic-like serine/threonine-protein kinase